MGERAIPFELRFPHGEEWDGIVLANPIPPGYTRCPCCKDGNGWLFVSLQEFPQDAPQRQKCCHCDGKGVVPIEAGAAND